MSTLMPQPQVLEGKFYLMMGLRVMLDMDLATSLGPSYLETA
ncbi:MAG: hypothetical protein Q8O01_03420 [Candidatus Omnitrophota bacterium]|nr:hypothetical protein [Candidatus Omnitrophota bacterium]